MTSRPLTTGMRSLLEEMASKGGVYAGSGLGRASQLSRLQDRGLARRTWAGGKWFITEDGRSFLAGEP